MAARFATRVSRNLRPAALTAPARVARLYLGLAAGDARAALAMAVEDLLVEQERRALARGPGRARA